jgi:hypothetical protein
MATRIRAIDTREALTGRRVAAWSAADLPEAARPILAGAEGAHKGRPFAARVLAGDVVRYVGECVAVVVADNPYRLADAIERVAVEYEPLPASSRGGTLASDGFADWPCGWCRLRSIGDAEQALFRRRRGRERHSATRAAAVHRDARRAGLSRSDSGRLVSGRPRRTAPIRRRRAHRRQPAGRSACLRLTWAAASALGALPPSPRALASRR